VFDNEFIIRKFKQWWSTIPPNINKKYHLSWQLSWCK